MEPNLHQALKLYRKEQCPIWMDSIKTTDPLLPEGNTKPIALYYNPVSGTVDIEQFVTALRCTGKAANPRKPEGA